MLKSNNYEALRLFTLVLSPNQSKQPLAPIFNHPLIDNFQQILLSFEQPSLKSKAVTNKAIMISGEIVHILSDQKDKSLFDVLFEWNVERLAMALQGGDEDKNN